MTRKRHIYHGTTTGYNYGCRGGACRAAKAKYRRERYKRNRDAAIAQLGGACAYCGDTVALELDHIDPATKSAKFIRVLFWGEERRQKELAKAQLLCKPCHIEKSRREYVS